MHGCTPKLGYFHDSFAISGMHQAVVGRLVFIAKGNGPVCGRYFNWRHKFFHFAFHCKSALHVCAIVSFLVHNDNIRTRSFPRGHNLRRNTKRPHDGRGQISDCQGASHQVETQDANAHKHTPFNGVVAAGIGGRADHFAGKDKERRRPFAAGGPSFAFLLFRLVVQQSILLLAVAVPRVPRFFNVRRHCYYTAVLLLLSSISS